jgi:DNA-binding NarL/FixJ family response regulator
MILIVEDHPLVRSSLLAWLTPAFADCGFREAVSGEEAIELAAAQPPAVVLMDVGLPNINGIEAARIIKTASPRTRIIMLSIQEASTYLEAAAAAGASAYIPKRRMIPDLIPAVQKLLAEWQAEAGSPAVS